MTNTTHWTTYWRNTLADGERNEIDITSVDKNKVLFLKPEQISIDSGNLDNTLAKRLFDYLNQKEEDKESDIKITSIPVLVSIFSIAPIAESAIKTEEKEMFPFWLKAILKIDGSLQPDEESFPYIPRVFLEPQLSEKYFYTLSDIETIDRAFYDLNDGANNWKEYWKYIQNIFQKITQQNIDEYRIENYLTKYRITLVVNDALKGASDGIIKLYDFILKNDYHSKLYDRIADVNFPANKLIRDIKDYENDTQLHYGQMNFEFPLSFTQRNALYHFVQDNEGDAFALNGPPGTGKTTLLQSVVANEFVKKAIEGTEPSIIVATSTNNQAVVNIIDSFTKAKTKDGKLSGRWLPDLKSYGLYLPAKAKNVERDISPDILYHKFTGEGFPSKVQTPEYTEAAKDFFLDKFETFAGYMEYSVSEAVRELRSELLKIDNSLKTGIDCWKEYKGIFKLVEKYSSQEDATKYFTDSRLKLDFINSEYSKLKDIQTNYLDYLAKEPWWKKLLILFFRNERAANLAACFNNCPVDYSLVNFYKLKTLNEFFNLKFQLIGQIKQLNESWNNWKKNNNIKSNPPLSFEELKRKEKRNQNYFYNELETGIKHEAFQLATHYWEGRWIMEMENLDADTLRKNNEDNALRRWRRFAKLTPCFVSTFYMIPKFFTYSRFIKALSNGKPLFESPSIIEGIDLLIVDEAGQVAPEVGAASFALAKKAIVVGDVKQIEPVWNVPSKVDYSNLVRHGIVNGENDTKRIEKLDDLGYLGSSGSIMKLAQKSCNYQLHELEERGFLLTEHRRCYNEIIQYCNVLAYNNLLEPRRGKSKNEPFIPMSLIHVNGVSYTMNKSRANKEEALAIAEWLLENQSRILEFYGKKAMEEYENTDKSIPYRAPELKDLVGIITPFAAQKFIISRTLKWKGIMPNGMKIGTVHALQGAERPIVIFSTVYSGKDLGKGYFFDRGNKPNMLNVAVSRSKDCFIVFGNRNIFNKKDNTPSAKLSPFLKEV